MKSTIIPAIRYHDAPKMIDWLCDAFGFTKHFVVEDGNGGIAHAQLTFGGGMVMLGSDRKDEFGALQSTPKALGGRTQSTYIISMMWMRCMNKLEKSEPRLRLNQKTRNMVAGLFHALTPKAIYGVSAVMTHGKQNSIK